MDSQPPSSSAPTGEIVLYDGDGDFDKLWYDDDLDLSDSTLWELESSDWSWSREEVAILESAIERLPAGTPGRSWSREEDRILENAIVSVPEGTRGRWERIATMLEGRTGEDVRARYGKLVEDLEAIMSGTVTPPHYDDDYALSLQGPTKPPRPKKSHVIGWTDEEHRSFLEGMEEFGKGCWREISRKYVKSRSATQVASHAQKYFLRRCKKESNVATKRKSIHDVTLNKKDANT